MTGHPAALLLEALVLAAIAATFVVGPALYLVRRGAWSGHLRKHVLGASVLACVSTLALAAAAPGPVGCIMIPCIADPDRASHAARASFASTATAAGKFPDLHVTPAMPMPPAHPPSPAEGLASVLVLVWGAGALFSLARVSRRRWLSHRIVRAARPVRDPALRARYADVRQRLGVRARVPLLQHPGLASPVIAGALRPALLLPARADGSPELEPAEADIVFLHELSHVRRRDPAATLAYELAAALLWFHPFVAGAARRIRELQEVSADSDVLRSGIKPSAYAAYLLDAVRRFAADGDRRLLDQHPIAGDCIMETRLRVILDPTSRHDPPRARTAAALTCAALSLSAAFAFAPLALQASGALPGAAQDPADMREDLLRPEALDSLLRPVFIDHMAERYIAGAAVAVVHGGEVVYQAGFGRREVFHEVPVDVERTIWRIGSITKVLTGVAVLQLADRGLIDLDEDVNAYFDDPIVPRDGREPVRVRHLLTHTAGFDQVGLGRHVASLEDVRPMEDFLREYLSRIRDPGVLSTYDTYGITLAGLLVERVSGLPYAEYLERRIFEPLRMHRSGIAVPPALRGDVAVGYGFAGHWEAAPWEFMNTAPASTVNATVPDMANFAMMLLNEGRFDGKTVLEAGSARGMLTTQFTNHPDQPGYSFTFFEDRGHGVPAFSHGGSMTGYASFLYLVPDHDLGIVLAYNQESGSLAERVVSAVVGALFPGRQAPRLHPQFEAAIDIRRFEGTYANSLHHHASPDTGWSRQPFELRADERGRLLFEGAPAIPVGPLSFQREDGLLLTFLEDDGGGISHLVVNQTVFEKLD